MLKEAACNGTEHTHNDLQVVRISKTGPIVAWNRVYPTKGGHFN